MLSQLDNIIFPDYCDVLEIVPSQQYVYPIFKNCSSSLYDAGYRTISKEEILVLSEVEVYVRNPWERFVTGVQTYLRDLDPALDKKTALYYIENHLFLNRHFCPQVFWLLNLQRFTRANIKLLPIDSISNITSFNVYKETPLEADTELYEHLAKNPKAQFYLQMDKVLTEQLIRRTVTFRDIIKTIQQTYPDLYTEVFERSIELTNHVVP